MMYCSALTHSEENEPSKNSVPVIVLFNDSKRKCVQCAGEEAKYTNSKHSYVVTDIIVQL